MSPMRPLVALLVFGFTSMFSVLAAPLQIRVATYNASLNRSTQGQLITDLSTGSNAQAKQVAEILQRVRPDIVLINEFDYDSSGTALTYFHNNYLAVSQNGQAPLSYPYRYAAPSNTGIASGFDLDNNGFANTAVPSSGATSTTKDRYGNDCFGFGWFPGQYSFVVYSKFPIQTSAIRSFQKFLWKDMPGAVLPDDVNTATLKDWYSAAELNVFRLSSKNHCDLPIEVAPGQIIHLLASHPTPPSFESGSAAIASDYNGHRNHDEIRLWADYISNASYLYDDAGVHGGLGDEQRFIILGDMNADPLDGDSYLGAIDQLRNHPLVNSTTNPSSLGGPQQSQLQGGVNSSQRGNPAYDTSDFSDGGAGNLRVDHVLPSKLGLSPVGGGVFWPLNNDPTFPLVSASDHRLVYLDLVVLPINSKAVQNLQIQREGSDAVLKWGTQEGVSYKIEQSADLQTWSDAPQVLVTFDAASQSATATDPSALEGVQKFYRVATALDGTSAAGALVSPGSPSTLSVSSLSVETKRSGATATRLLHRRLLIRERN